MPLPSGLNDGEWYEFSIDLQEVLDNLDSGTTLTDIDYIEWRGEADYDTCARDQCPHDADFHLGTERAGWHHLDP